MTENSAKTEITDNIDKTAKAKTSKPAGIILLALVINLYVETLSRHSLIDALEFMFCSPVQFVYGVLIICLTLTLSLFFTRRVFACTFISAVWLIIGTVNGVVRVFRHTPFTAQDLRLISYAYKVAPIYLKKWQMVLIAVGVVLFLALLVYWWFKAPKRTEKVNYMKVAVIVLTMSSVTWVGTSLGMTFGIFAKNFGNIGAAYNEYGFAYCFLSSLLNSGIDRPKNYNEEAIWAILEKIDAMENTGETVTAELPTDSDSINEGDNNLGDERNNSDSVIETEADLRVYPNIIFVQLESLFDPDLLLGVEYTQTVIPNLQYLYTTCPSGLLYVPSVGAGTANTEFEVISGMNLDDFGPGEYPYKTVLQRKACESVCYDLKQYGYTCSALHNNDGTFYDRYIAFAQLGFDTFTSIEYMDEVERNILGWADDSCLTKEILEILDSSEKQDFIYAVSVEGHGDYPDDYEPSEDDILAEGEPIEEYLSAFTYYINAIHKEDEFVGELVSAVSERDEPTVIVFFGDHLPAFDISDEELLQGNTFSTRYVVYNNMNLQKKDEDVQAYQLSSVVLEMLDIDGMAVSSYHRAMRNSEDEEKYLTELKLLEYDILYGNRDIYDGTLPYSSTNLKMGHKNITINGVQNKGDHVFVTGTNFTPFSEIYVNDEMVESEFVDTATLFIDNYNLEPGDLVKVVQQGTDGVVLSGTSQFVYK